MGLSEMTICDKCGKEAHSFGCDWKECTNCGGHYATQGDPCCGGCCPCEKCDKYVDEKDICEDCFRCPNCCTCELNKLSGGHKGCDRDKDFINV